MRSRTITTRWRLIGRRVRRYEVGYYYLEMESECGCGKRSRLGKLHLRLHCIMGVGGSSNLVYSIYTHIAFFPNDTYYYFDMK
jgi:hypothetical protein